MSNDTFVNPLDLEGDLLDYCTARALGLEAIGYALCHPYPDSNHPEIAEEELYLK